jgi:hypothetical protein
MKAELDALVVSAGREAATCVLGPSVLGLAT